MLLRVPRSLPVNPHQLGKKKTRMAPWMYQDANMVQANDVSESMLQFPSVQHMLRGSLSG